MGAEGPKNVAQTAEIADGWLAIFYSLSLADQYESWLAEGFARPGARRTRDDFEVAATVQVVITDDVAAAVVGDGRGRVHPRVSDPLALEGLVGEQCVDVLAGGVEGVVTVQTHAVTVVSG